LSHAYTIDKRDEMLFSGIEGNGSYLYGTGK